MAKKRKTAKTATGRSSLSAKQQDRPRASGRGGLTRRGFMQGVGVAGGVAVVAKERRTRPASPRCCPPRRCPSRST